MDLQQCGRRVREQRLRSGLLQAQLASLTGLSRVTINQLENGTLNDIGYSKLKAVFDVLGLRLGVDRKRTMFNGVAMTARSISGSFREPMPPEVLREALLSGRAPEQFRPHLMALLDQAPLPLVFRVIAEVAQTKTEARQIARHLSRWAGEWKSVRQVWQ
jgi:transcriptional regulator with XRE-family HTH domain